MGRSWGAFRGATNHAERGLHAPATRRVAPHARKAGNGLSAVDPVDCDGSASTERSLPRPGTATRHRENDISGCRTAGVCSVGRPAIEQRLQSRGAGLLPDRADGCHCVGVRISRQKRAVTNDAAAQVARALLSRCSAVPTEQRVGLRPRGSRGALPLSQALDYSQHRRIPQRFAPPAHRGCPLHRSSAAVAQLGLTLVRSFVDTHPGPTATSA